MKIKERPGIKYNRARYDIYIDKSTRKLWVFRKGAQGGGEPTDIIIED